MKANIAIEIPDSVWRRRRVYRNALSGLLLAFIIIICGVWPALFVAAWIK